MNYCNKINIKDIDYGKFIDSFHGETWYKCPWCNKSYESYDMTFERGFEKTEIPRVYRHECGKYIKRV